MAWGASAEQHALEERAIQNHLLQLSLCDFGDIPKVTHRREELLAHMLCPGVYLAAGKHNWADADDLKRSPNAPNATKSVEENKLVTDLSVDCLLSLGQASEACRC